jgi:hypothetical protein
VSERVSVCVCVCVSVCARFAPTCKSSCAAALMLIGAASLDESGRQGLEDASLAVFSMVVRILMGAGYTERAIALLQAMLEFNFGCPSGRLSPATHVCFSHFPYLRSQTSRQKRPNSTAASSSSSGTRDLRVSARYLASAGPSGTCPSV